MACYVECGMRRSEAMYKAEEWGKWLGFEFQVEELRKFLKTRRQHEHHRETSGSWNQKSCRCFGISKEFSKIPTFDRLWVLFCFGFSSALASRLAGCQATNYAITSSFSVSLCMHDAHGAIIPDNYSTIITRSLICTSSSTIVTLSHFYIFGTQIQHHTLKLVEI